MIYSRKTVYTRLGKITLVSKDNKLTNLYFSDQKIPDIFLQNVSAEIAPVLNKAEKQLTEYFEGLRSKFDLEMDLEGTEFQKKVWNELLKIPYGETISYQELAKRTGSINNARAVGSANGKNPVSIIVPCHRVINKSGKLGGYGGGLDIKKQLLEIEKG
jgi:methylated-DNA-[protein]-cysteine S-methyltransferase